MVAGVVVKLMYLNAKKSQNITKEICISFDILYQKLYPFSIEDFFLIAILFVIIKMIGCIFANNCVSMKIFENMLDMMICKIF